MFLSKYRLPLLIDKLAWIYIRNGLILSTRSKGKSKYYIPGGKREGSETDLQALKREIGEELGISLIDDSLQFYGAFVAQADGHEPGVDVQMTCYTADFKGTIRPMNEIAEVVWLNYSDREKVSAVDKLIFEQLVAEQVLQ